ncbi:MAG: non-canonical purine NTP pyrophosphatase, RdgB/HAM1 family [Acidobacteria bacterium RBG_16_68_9]|nr:MAG: non-canonical purine NTP pyrophosphatase, RdgB/HAM1 family [Acidobacteria bacterium RBG_16_68_9]
MVRRRGAAAPYRPVLVIATRNPGKRREFAQLLLGLPVDLADLNAFPDAPRVREDHESYLENARAKALAVARLTGRPALADDSGLEVNALGGAPGVRSARYAGDEATDGDNVERLLGDLSGVPEKDRTARFRCVIVVADPNGAFLTSEATCEGRIATEGHGSGGFGYDPVFYCPEAGRTFAEMAPEEKNRVSHRARACNGLRPHLSAFLRDWTSGD